MHGGQSNAEHITTYPHAHLHGKVASGVERGARRRREELSGLGEREREQCREIDQSLGEEHRGVNEKRQVRGGVETGRGDCTSRYRRRPRTYIHLPHGPSHHCSRTSLIVRVQLGGGGCFRSWS